MQRAENPDYELMKKLLKETANSLGMDTKKAPVTNDVPDSEMKKIITDKLLGKVPEE